jgi:hypothetical protein
MRAALGYPLQEVALVALVAGFCWTFGCIFAQTLYHAFAELFRRRGP